MPQSMLALFAIFGISFLALQGSRDRIADLEETYRGDAEVQARGVGVEVLERLSAFPFDGGEGGSLEGTGTEMYSPVSAFGTSVATSGLPLGTLFNTPAIDDLDDFHGVRDAVARITVFDPVSASAQSLEIDVSISVAYVERDGAGDWGPVASPSTRTNYKRVVVTLDSPYFPTPARLGRIFVAP